MKNVLIVLLMAVAYLATFILGACSGAIHPKCYAYIHCKAACEQSVGKVKGVTSLRRFCFFGLPKKAYLCSLNCYLSLWALPSVC